MEYDISSSGFHFEVCLTCNSINLNNITELIYADSLIKQLEGSVEENKSRLNVLDSRLRCMEQELKLKDDVCMIVSA